MVTLPNATRVFYVVQDWLFCSIRRRIAAHLFSSSAIWRASSATPIPEIGVVQTQLCQPCFQGDLTLGDNAVFRFHSLELNYQIFSVRHATCQLAGYGYFVYLLLV